MEVDRPGGLQDELRDPPARARALEAVAVAAPELAVWGAVAVAVPGVQVGDAARLFRSLELDLDVRDVVARGREDVLEPDGDRGGDRLRADDRRRLGSVVDRRTGSEERGDRLRLVAVEMEAVGVDQVDDLLPIDELLHDVLESH